MKPKVTDAKAEKTAIIDASPKEKFERTKPHSNGGTMLTAALTKMMAAKFAGGEVKDYGLKDKAPEDNSAFNALVDAQYERIRSSSVRDYLVSINMEPKISTNKDEPHNDEPQISRNNKM